MKDYTVYEMIDEACLRLSPRDLAEHIFYHTDIDFTRELRDKLEAFVMVYEIEEEEE